MGEGRPPIGQGVEPTTQKPVPSDFMIKSLGGHKPITSRPAPPPPKK